MTEYTNNSRGGIVLNGKSDASTKERPLSEPVLIAPGATVDVDVVDPKDKVLRGHIDSGRLTEGKAKPKQLSREEQAEADAERFRNDPHQVSNREAAEAAGNTEGLVDLSDREEEEDPEDHEAEAEGRPRRRVPRARARSAR